MFQQVKVCTIVGVGLMGASLAAALKEAKICQEIIGVDTNEANLAKAKEKKLIDRRLC